MSANDVDVIRMLPEGCHSVRPRPNEIRQMNTHWQVFQHRDVYISMYSAFFDTRSIRNDSTPFVYINAVAKQLSKKRKDEPIATPVPSAYYCQLWYASRLHPVVVGMTYTRNEFLRPVDGTMYSTYLLACPLSDHRTPPTHVSVTYGRCDQASTYLPLSDTRQDAEQHEFGLCMAVGFGRLAPERIVEWFEFHRLLGVTEFNVYDVNLRGLKSVFDHYEEVGVLRVRAIASPISSRSVTANRLASQVVLNDCLMRNKNRYGQAVVVDFDEIMWPNRPSNFSSLIRRVQAASGVRLPVIGYAFRNAYHVLSYPEDDSQPWYLRTMRFRYRLPPTPWPHKIKSIVNPRMCIVVYHHSCLLPAYSEHGSVIVVDPALAMSHHYRKCPDDMADSCRVVPPDPDDLVLSYKNMLISRVEPVLRKIGLL